MDGSLNTSLLRAPLCSGNKVKVFVQKIGEKTGDRSGGDCCTQDGSRGFLAFTRFLLFASVPRLLAVFHLPSLDCRHGAAFPSSHLHICHNCPQCVKFSDIKITRCKKCDKCEVWSLSLLWQGDQIKTKTKRLPGPSFITI